MRLKILLFFGLIFIYMNIISCWPFPMNLYNKIKIRIPCLSDAKLAGMGLQSFNEGRYHDALYCFNRAIAKRMDQSSYYRWKANCYVKLGDLDLALYTIQDGARVSPLLHRICWAETFSLDDEALMKLGEKLLVLKEYDKAEQCFSMAIQKNSNNVMCYERRAFCFQEMNQKARAILDYRKMLQLDSNNQNGRTLLISALLDSEEYNAAIEETLRWDDNTELAKLADTFYSKDKFVEAAKCYSRLIMKIDRNDASWAIHRENRGQCCFMANDYTNAILDFEEVLKFDPQKKSVWVPLIESLFHSKRYDEALKKMRELNDDDTFQRMADKFLSVEKYEHALSCYTLAIERNPLEASLAYKLRGLCYTKMGELDKAISDFEEALRLDPSTEDGRVYLAVALFDSGKSEKAFEETLLMNETELSNLGNRLYSKQKYQEAIHCYTEAIERKTKESTLAKSYGNRGRCYVELEKFLEAIEDFERSLNLLPNNPQIQVLYLVTLDKVGKYEMVKTVLKDLEIVDHKFLTPADQTKVHEICEKIEKMDKRNSEDVILKKRVQFSL